MNIRNASRLLWVAVAVLTLTVPALGQGLGQRYSLDELKQMADGSTLLVRARATEAPVSVGSDANGLAWRVAFEVTEVIKGQYAGKTLELHLTSAINNLGESRKSLEGKEYVLPLVAYAEKEPNKFKLVANAGFSVGSAEAKKLIEIVTGKVAAPEAPASPEAPAAPTAPAAPVTAAAPAAGVISLRLESGQAAYESGKPILIKADLENATSEAVSYDQLPCAEQGGELFIIGSGSLAVTDSNETTLDPRPALHVGDAKATPLPSMKINAGHGYLVSFDLTKYFDLSRPGLYTVAMLWQSPDGKGTVGALPLTIRIIEPLSAPVTATGGKPTAAEEMRVPPPDAYQPGEMVNGLVALLKPLRSEYSLGEKINLELRLINVGEVPANLDTRLERTILVAVQEQGTSPPAVPLWQRISWPEDPEDRPSEYPLAHLQTMAFWGKLVDINSAYGRDPASIGEPLNAPAPGTKVSYETHGMTLFAFNNPGVYKVQITYSVKPRAAKGPKIWAGKVVTNPVFIRVTGKKAAAPLVTPSVEPQE